jgi:hypothetical protein
MIHEWNLYFSAEGDYIGYLRVIGHTDMLTDTTVTVDVSSDDRRRSGFSGPPARKYPSTLSGRVFFVVKKHLWFFYSRQIFYNFCM